MSDGTSRSLRYRVVHCSSTERAYGVWALHDANPHSAGWRSTCFSDYPVEMVLGFHFTAVDISQISFILHEFMIPRSVEIHLARELSPEAQLSDDAWRSCSFERVGSVSFDSNERAQYRQREMKTVQLKGTAVLVRFVFAECHMNVHNLCHQISVVAIGVHGRPALAEPAALSAMAAPKTLGQSDLGLPGLDSELLALGIDITALDIPGIERVDSETYF